MNFDLRRQQEFPAALLFIAIGVIAVAVAERNHPMAWHRRTDSRT